jgi:hypothetical protein
MLRQAYYPGISLEILRKFAKATVRMDGLRAKI